MLYALSLIVILALLCAWGLRSLPAEDRFFTRDALGASLELRNAWIQSIITVAGAGAKVKLYNGTRPATGAAITSQVLLATLTMGATLGTATGGQLDFDEAGMSQTNSAHVTGTPTWLRIEKSGGAHVVDMSIPADATFTGTVTTGVNVTMNASTVTAPNA